jgi:hypothetical protein
MKNLNACPFDKICHVFCHVLCYIFNLFKDIWPVMCFKVLLMQDSRIKLKMCWLLNNPHSPVCSQNASSRYFYRKCLRTQRYILRAGNWSCTCSVRFLHVTLNNKWFIKFVKGAYIWPKVENVLATNLLALSRRVGNHIFGAVAEWMAN